MIKSQSFLFSNWKKEHIEIVSPLVPCLCRNQAGLYGVNFPKYPVGHPPDQIIQEVRVGWPNPAFPTGKKKHILSVFSPGTLGVLWELRLHPRSEYITKGKLERLKEEIKTKGQESQKAKGCFFLTGTNLPEEFEKWIEAAFEYTLAKYKIGQ